jgi:hypothetical protein
LSDAQSLRALNTSPPRNRIASVPSSCSYAALDAVRNFHKEDGTKVRDFSFDNLLVRIHLIIVMIRWTGLAPWEFKFSVPCSLPSTFLDQGTHPYTLSSSSVSLSSLELSHTQSL